MPVRPTTHLIQFALGWAVAPERRATVRLTARFRAAVLRNLIRTRQKAPRPAGATRLPIVRDEIVGMTGKDAQGEPLRGPRAHAEFLLWWDSGVPTRLLVWRGARPFDKDEQESILRAAAQELSWAAAGPDAEAWKIKLVPLDAAVSPPPGFDGASAKTWQTLTPYVPPRHYLRGGNVRHSETIENQIQRELAARGYASGTKLLSVEEIGPTGMGRCACAETRKPEAAVHRGSPRSDASSCFRDPDYWSVEARPFQQLRPRPIHAVRLIAASTLFATEEYPQINRNPPPKAVLRLVN